MSQASFSFPGYPAVKQMPSIKDLVSRPLTVGHVEQGSAPGPSPASVATEQHSEVPEPEASSPAAEPEPEKEETLESNWDEVVEAIFKNLPMLYYSLKKTVPTYEQDVLKVEVSNSIQEEELRQRKRAVLEYWRNHFKMNVDDFEIVLNEDKVTETAILTSEEQFQRMKEQNPELLEFLDILKFRMKY
ncbi:MAG: hypothetical protein IKU03_08860 [Bacteroidales bacterium]|nr:hypothetical protein [Bacteroidales bacterium]